MHCCEILSTWSLTLRHVRLAIFPRIRDHDIGVGVGVGCSKGAKGQWGKLINSPSATSASPSSRGSATTTSVSASASAARGQKASGAS